MTFDDLVDFLLNRKTMSHIYQSLLIRSLVGHGSGERVNRVTVCTRSIGSSGLAVGAIASTTPRTVTQPVNHAVVRLFGTGHAVEILKGLKRKLTEQQRATIQTP